MGQISEVINTGNQPYTEEYQGEKLTIPPGGSIRMPRRKAVDFLGSFHPMPGAPAGQPKPLVIKHMGVPDKEKFISPKDGQEFDSHADYVKHLEQFKEEAIKDEETTKPEVKKVYVCPHCDKECGSKAALIKHMRSHDTKPDLL
jgi:hypothetical protein